MQSMKKIAATAGGSRGSTGVIALAGTPGCSRQVPSRAEPVFYSVRVEPWSGGL